MTGFDDAWVQEARKTERAGVDRIADARRIAGSRPVPWRSTATATVTPRRRRKGRSRPRPPRPWDRDRCPQPGGWWLGVVAAGLLSALFGLARLLLGT